MVNDHRQQSPDFYNQIVVQWSMTIAITLPVMIKTMMQEPLANNDCWQFTWVGAIDETDQTQPKTCK